jgi:hypothetical protein
MWKKSDIDLLQNIMGMVFFGRDPQSAALRFAAI